jgi:predicted signal transduction protein with EAL and GGDEF domain/FixJ family two-component response regulator
VSRQSQENEDILFLDDDEVGSGSLTMAQRPWLVAVVDDEQAVYDATALALTGMVFDGRPVKLLYADSAEAGRRLLEEMPDIACILLDVVMETDHAGLDFAREIREILGNQAIRIVLRTGQPGYAPPIEVIQRYDINDYKEKTELTRTRLWTSVVCALRSYKQIMALEHSRQGLQTIIAASSDLTRRRGIDEFSRGIVTRLAAHLGLAPDGLLVLRQSSKEPASLVIGAAGRFVSALAQPIERIADAAVIRTIDLAFEQRSEVIGAQDLALYIAGSDWTGVIYLAGQVEVSEQQQDLLRLFCRNVALGLENVRLFEQVAELAYIDRITGLATRPRLEQVIEGLTAAGAIPSALAINIDGFSDYTTGLGEEFGELVLKSLAARLRELCPEPDQAGCLYRNVFCVILQDREIEGLRAELLQPITIGDQRLRLGLTMGLSGAHSAPASDIIREAEIALKAAKQGLRSYVLEFSPGLELNQRSRALLAHELREALDTDQVSLVYQPQVDVRSRTLIGAEALMRWQHPIRGPLSPLEFIEAAEAAGLIGDVGRWVVRRACRDMKPLVDAGLIQRIMINLSPVQLRDPDCLGELCALVESAAVPYSAIEWEITESATTGGDSVLAQLQQAKDLGCTIALDDFGTGYSSLSMIRSLPLNVVKIDRSFLLEVTTNRRAWTILFSVASICHELGLQTVAEGVETEAQLDVVRDANINTIQGYLIARPLPAPELAAWLAVRPR